VERLDNNYEKYPISSHFAATCMESSTTLMSVIVITIFVLGFVSAGNPFTADGAPKTWQRDMVMGVYFSWFKYVLVCAIILTIGGLTQFFYSIKYMVMIKYTDVYVAASGNAKPYLAMDSNTTYGYSEDMIFYVIWFPTLILSLIASKAQHHVYTYPIRPWSNLQYNELEDRAYRFKVVEKMVDQILGTTQLCHLPNTEQLHASGPGEWCGIEALGGLNTFDVFLTQAGVGTAGESQIVAHALVDAGIDTLQDLHTICITDPGWVRDLPGVSLWAATAIVSKVIEEDSSTLALDYKRAAEINTTDGLKVASPITSPSKGMGAAAEGEKDAAGEVVGGFGFSGSV